MIASLFKMIHQSNVQIKKANIRTLIDYNTGLLLDLLESVAQSHVTQELDLLDNMASKAIQLPNAKTTTTLLSYECQSQMKDFVSCIASMYRDIPYHNFEHASHVTQSSYVMVKRITHQGIAKNPLAKFALVFSALIHDVDHTGLTNEQLIKRDKQLSRKFKRRSIAEQNSILVAWRLLIKPRFDQLRRHMFANEYEKKRFRQLITCSVMATDICDCGGKKKRDSLWEILGDDSSSAFREEESKTLLLMEHLLQLADIVHTMQDWDTFLKWTFRLYHEKYLAYTNGQDPKDDPSQSWFQCQICFFDNYVIPLAKKLDECGVMEDLGTAHVRGARRNRDQWIQMGAQETKRMIRKTRTDWSMNGLAENITYFSMAA